MTTNTVSRRSIIAGFFGNVLEWYDFTVYGFFASIIGQLFFPHEDKTVQLISAFGVFAAGYLMRPIGGIIMGHIGDKQGRKKALLISILMMAIPTTLIGVLPTYSQAGWYAALMLVVLRLVQGLSVGGEFTGSMSFLIEKAPKGKRGYYGSWTTFGVIGGMLLGSLIGSIITSNMSHAQVIEFGWRIPFLLGAVIGIAGLFLRRGMGEDEEFSKMKESGTQSKSPLKEFWRDYKKPSIKIILMSWGFAVSVYLVFIFMPSYLHDFHNVKLDTALSAHTIAMIVMMILIPVMGKWSDYSGRKTVLLVGFGGFILATFPMFWLLFKDIYWGILAGMLGFALFEAMLQAAMPATMAEMFPTKVRYTGLSVSYNISLALFGGTTPLLATWLVKLFNGNVWMPAFYLAITALISFITALTIKETKNKELL